MPWSCLGSALPLNGTQKGVVKCEIRVSMVMNHGENILVVSRTLMGLGSGTGALQSTRSTDVQENIMRS